MTFETIICPGCKLPFEVDIDKILNDGNTSSVRIRGNNLHRVKYVDLECPRNGCKHKFEYPLP